MMLKLRLIGLTLLAFSAATLAHAEEKRYVSDELNTWVRSPEIIIASWAR
jgi:SH3 domain protein